MNSRTDQELVYEYAEHGSEAAFAELVRRHVDLVYSAALRMVRDAHLAEDVAQSAFLALAQNARQLTNRRVLTGWLHCTARNLAAKVVRGDVRRRAREQEAAAMNELPANDSDASWEAIAPYLDAALGELSEADRDALLLRYFERKSAREMAQSLGVSEEASQKRVGRAVERLRDIFAKHGITVGAGALVGVISANAVHAAPVGLSVQLTTAAVSGVANANANLAAVKTAVRLLAWTKAKTVILVGLSVLIVAGLALKFQSSHPASGTKSRLPVGKGVSVVAMGHSHGLILASDGSLWSWGTNYAGWPVLGLDSIGKQSSLHRIGKENDWISISSSSSHCLALKSDGTLWAWGENLSGQVGSGAPVTQNTMQNTPTPSAPGNDWQQVAAGGSHSLALKQDGTLWAWGLNWAGQLGIGSTEHEVYEVTQVGTATNWVKIWAGILQTVGQQSDGSLWFWGSLTGSSTDPNRFLVPARVSEDTNWVDVGFGYYVVFAIKADGTLWAWGRNAGIYTGAPIQLVNPKPARVGTDSDWLECSDSGRFYHLLKKKDGSLWALDAMDYSWVNKAHYKPIEFRRVPLRKDIVAFDAGASSLGPAGAVLTRDGEVWTWGRVLGEYTPGHPKMQEWAHSLGWKTRRFDSKPVMRNEPWLLPVTE